MTAVLLLHATPCSYCEVMRGALQGAVLRAVLLHIRYVADATSHEAGHTLGLSHDGVTGGSAYYSGQGNW
jgi:cation transport regulator ChaC